MKDFKYTFSVVIVACNGKPHVTEAIESLVAQDIGFVEHMQLILADAGSTDGTDHICRMYANVFPKNVIYLPRDGKSLSEVRHEALPLLQGKYVNFMAQDKLFSSDAFSKVAAFFQKHEGEVEMAFVVPMSDQSSRLERVTGPHEEHDSLQMELGNAFMPLAIARAMSCEGHLQSNLFLSRYGEQSQLCPREKEISLQVHGGETFVLPDCVTCLERMEFSDDKLTLEGKVSLPGPGELADMQIFLQVVDSSPVPCEIKKSGAAVFFRGRFDQLLRRSRWEVAVCMEINGFLVEQKKLCGGQDFPLATEFNESYAVHDGWMIRLQGSCLVLERSEPEELRRQEERLQEEMEHSKKPGAEEGVQYRRLYYSLKPLCQKEIWLIADRIRKADDSGAALFQYLGQAEHPVEAYFVLRQRQEQDYVAMSVHGQVLDFNSRVHFIAGLLADKVISSTTDPRIGNPVWHRKRYLRDILWKQKFIYMGHVATKENWLRSWGHYEQKGDLLLASSESEYRRILGSMPFPKSQRVQLAGLPCYDCLMKKDGEGRGGLRQIAIMPTWRKALAWNRTYYIDGVKRHNPDKLRASRYFQFYQALLDSPKLIEGARKYGYVLRFMPHPHVAHYMYCFHRTEGVVFFSPQDRYEDVLGESNLVVTDYSSVSFEAAYLGKPVLYCQFDRDDFCGVCRSEGFDYSKEGFGEVCTDLESTVEGILSYMEQGCIQKEVYRLRAEGYFAFHDRQNCSRAYEAVRAL